MFGWASGVLGGWASIAAGRAREGAFHPSRTRTCCRPLRNQLSQSLAIPNCRGCHAATLPTPRLLSRSARCPPPHPLFSVGPAMLLGSAPGFRPARLAGSGLWRRGEGRVADEPGEAGGRLLGQGLSVPGRQSCHVMSGLAGMKSCPCSFAAGRAHEPNLGFLLARWVAGCVHGKAGKRG